MSFTFEPTEIADVVLVRPTRHGDERGYFVETYRTSAFAEAGLGEPLVQDNEARSGSGVLRGLHYQLPPKAQGKLVRVSRGAIFDVAVDLRRRSPSFGHWVGCRLDAEQGAMLWIPAGFAHGYVVLGEEGADVTYKVTAEYDADLDRGVRWDDPALGIEWPLDDPVISGRDAALPLLADAENPF